MMSGHSRPVDPSAFGKVAVVMGGWSAEREVSLNSGAEVLRGLISAGVDAHAVDATRELVGQLRDGDFDRAFLILHGRGGEDGTVQAALELAGIPYTGSGIAASALCMDKWRCKLIAQAVNVATPPALLIESRAALDQAADQIGLPLVVKPAQEGSSVGVSIVRERQGLDAAWAAVADYPPVMVEACVDGIELTATVLGKRALPLIAIRAASGFYDYNAKYELNDTRYDCPPDLPEDLQQAIQMQAVCLYDALGCEGWARVDFMLDEHGVAQFIECNTAPGMTTHSLVPMAARAAGLDFESLLLEILSNSVTLMRRSA